MTNKEKIKLLEIGYKQWLLISIMVMNKKRYHEPSFDLFYIKKRAIEKICIDNDTVDALASESFCAACMVNQDGCGECPIAWNTNHCNIKNSEYRRFIRKPTPQNAMIIANLFLDAINKQKEGV